MSRYINKYTNQSAIQDALDNETLSKPYVAYNEGQQTLDYNSLSKTDYSTKYFTVEALQSGYFTWVMDGDITSANVYYSLNNGAWTALGENIQVNTGDKIRFYGTNSSYAEFRFGPEYLYKVYGNIMSLLYGQNFIGQTVIENSFAFRSFFSQITPSNLVDCSNLILPATTLANHCYNSMFFDCSSLTTAPALPATTLAQSCYQQMFSYCTSLTTAPELPATTLATQCYNSMFYRCSSLNYIKCLATDISASDCTYNWVDNVASSGTFVKKSGVSWPIGTGGIPSGWTVVEV